MWTAAIRRHKLVKIGHGHGRGTGKAEVNCYYLPGRKELDEDVIAGNSFIKGLRVQLYGELLLRLLAGGGVLVLGRVGSGQESGHQQGTSRDR